MKAGIIETADICVVNKADRPGAEKLVAELRAISKWRAKRGEWSPPILSLTAIDGTGVRELAEAIGKHRAHVISSDRENSVARSRRNFHLKSTVHRQLDELIDATSEEDTVDSSRLYDRILSHLPGK